MNVSLLFLFAVVFWLLWMDRENKKKLAAKMIAAKRKGHIQMKELASRFIGKDCLVYTFSSQLAGIIREVTDGALMLENEGKLEAVNLDFVTRIREYPIGKNGKRKTLVGD